MEGVNIFEKKEKRASADLWCGTNLRCLNYIDYGAWNSTIAKWNVEFRKSIFFVE